MSQHHLGERLAARLPDDDVTLATLLAGGGVASAGLLGAWVATEVAGRWVPALLAASVLAVPGILAVILATASTTD